MKIAIIIPCYNSGEILANNLPTLFSYIDNDKNNIYKVYVVNDGSSDCSCTFLEREKRIILLHNEKNKGKGNAIKHAVKYIEPCDAVLYKDSDFSTKIDCLNKFIKELENHDVVIGSRFHKNSVMPLKRAFKRRVASKCCNIFVNALFRFNIKDTQCGFKLFKYDVIKKAAAKQTINDWSFDVEYLYMVKLNNYKIKEMPIEWIENYDSSIKIIPASIGFIKKSFQIKKHRKDYIF